MFVSSIYLKNFGGKYKIFFVKKGDTAKFWMTKNANLKQDANDRSGVVVREISK